MEVTLRGLYLFAILLTSSAATNQYDLHEQEELLNDMTVKAAARMIGCAYITSEAIEYDEDLHDLIQLSNHDTEAILNKLTAEICLYCCKHITDAFASQVTSPDWSFETFNPQLKALTQVDKTKYLSKDGNLTLTEDEEELMSLIVQMLEEEGEERGEEDPGVS